MKYVWNIEREILGEHGNIGSEAGDGSTNDFRGSIEMSTILWMEGVCYDSLSFAFMQGNLTLHRDRAYIKRLFLAIPNS